MVVFGLCTLGGQWAFSFSVSDQKESMISIQSIPWLLLPSLISRLPPQTFRLAKQPASAHRRAPNKYPVWQLTANRDHSSHGHTPHYKSTTKSSTRLSWCQKFYNLDETIVHPYVTGYCYCSLYEYIRWIGGDFLFGLYLSRYVSIKICSRRDYTSCRAN